MSLSAKGVADLKKSGLTAKDMNLRPVGGPELAAVGSGDASGYVIPYFDIEGEPTDYYRVRLFEGSVKYKQPKNTGSYVYFPPQLPKLLTQKNLSYLLLCEGEKKAAACCKAGIPAIAFGGVDSWKSRLIAVPDDSEVSKAHNSNTLNIRIPTGAENKVMEGGLAVGMKSLIDLATTRRLQLVVVYDTDTINGPKFEVQRAAAALGFMLRSKGVPFGKIKQLILPTEEDLTKSAVDDYIVKHGIKPLKELLKEVLEADFAFPIHPNMHNYISQKLRNPRIPRTDMISIATAILCDLESRGKRLRDKDKAQMYYFNHEDLSLLPATIDIKNGRLAETSFGQLLYRRYGVSDADNRLLQWLNTQFNGELPIREAKPTRVFHRVPADDIVQNQVRLQINDGQYAKVTSSNIVIKDNGTDGCMFVAGAVVGIDDKELKEAIRTLKKEPIKCWWDTVLKDVRLKTQTQENRTLISTLFYLSPWLQRWRGMQLPIELIIGEAGSGKSSLYEHRLNVITGFPELRNAPNDIKDWHASVTNTGGLHVIDNVNLSDKSFRQKLSDEICRLTTEPQPHIEMRKLYSNAELCRIPVNATFAITAIQQPFNQADLIQRAILIELDKSEEEISNPTVYDSSWVSQQMEKFGGRARWLAHHLIILQEFFRAVESRWDDEYSAHHRLVNFEQSLIIMADIFYGNSQWIPEYLQGINRRVVSESDWILEGIQAFVSFRLDNNTANKKVVAGEISEWANVQEDFKDNNVLGSPRMLGRYIKSHKALVEQICGLVESGKINNRVSYTIRSTQTSKQLKLKT